MTTQSPPTITHVTSATQRETLLPQLVTLLQDVVADGASIGFLPPLSTEEAHTYWNNVFDALATQNQILLIAQDGNTIVGTVQLELASKANARHRAEVQKLFVSPTQRRRGIAQLLMTAIEQAARNHNRTLLVLDTRQGDNAEKLYHKLGYTEAGIIPNYAINSEGGLDGTIYFYKLL